MKNNRIIIYVGLIIVLISISILYVFNNGKISDDILNKTWYKYNYKTGYYDIININSNTFSYIIPSNNNETNSYYKCTKYNYDSKNKKIKLNCNKSIIIKEINDNYIVLNIDNSDNYFYLSNTDSLNHEFNNVFNKSINEYKKSKDSVLGLIKVSTKKINEIYNDNEYSKIIFMGNNCTSVECTLGLDVIERWINFDNNVYYIDSSNFNNNDYKLLSKIGDDFNDVYPSVYVIKNKKVIDKYRIKCSGFDCSMYY